MKIQIHLRLIIAMGAFCSVFISTPSNAVDYFGNGYQIGVIRPGGDRPCTLFQLVGVAQADPVVPNSPWFVMEPSSPGYKEAVATLLAAKVSGRNIQVSTTGTVSTACGHPTVAVILML